ncbi:diguanylate cyclase [Acidimicrobiales bacterium]|nr:diguanylate cyclase [Acidimicrobiales bacterium]MDC1388837.1 diguanylate cyclase [Acidimicrobiales bacterium]
MTAERVVRIGAAAAAILAALGALVTTGDLEATLLMGAAVISGLVCLDASMDPRLRAFGPWLLLSLAPVLKTVPDVWFELRIDSGVLFERYDHAGSLLFGVCVLGAMVILARPAGVLGASAARFDTAVILGSATTGALAGVSVAFLFDVGFGSVAVGRLLETSTWFVLAGILAAAVVAASHAQHMPVALSGVCATGAATSVLLALSVAGRDLDRGWWAFLFAALAASAALGGGDLGSRLARDRRSAAPVVVVLVVGPIAAACAIVARSDRTAWSPGWALLGCMSISMFGLALASKSIDEQGEAQTASDPPDRGLDDVRRARRERRERARALEALDQSFDEVGALTRGTSGSGAGNAGGNRPENTVPSAAVAGSTDAKPVVERPTPVISPPLSDKSMVTEAQAAAAVRTAPQAQRHSLAPIAQAHHFDPSTGLLSAAGLQHALVRAFDVPRRAGHVTMLMFTIRDLDQIDKEHGRLASAAVTREVAERVHALLSSGSGARFSRASYAVVFVGDHANAHETTQWLARVLLKLRAPVEGGTFGDKIDVVAGMAQCYENEDAANFVKRATDGLARAERLAEPTLVAMP